MINHLSPNLRTNRRSYHEAETSKKLQWLQPGRHLRLNCLPLSLWQERGLGLRFTTTNKTFWGLGKKKRFTKTLRQLVWREGKYKNLKVMFWFWLLTFVVSWKAKCPIFKATMGESCPKIRHLALQAEVSEVTFVEKCCHPFGSAVVKNNNVHLHDHTSTEIPP